jgi:hypothetical protein
VTAASPHTLSPFVWSYLSRVCDFRVVGDAAQNVYRRAFYRKSHAPFAQRTPSTDTWNVIYRYRGGISVLSRDLVLRRPGNSSCQFWSLLESSLWHVRMVVGCVTSLFGEIILRPWPSAVTYVPYLGGPWRGVFKSGL